MNRLDLLLLAVAVLFLLVGVWRGLVRMVLGAAGLVVGVILAIRWEPQAAGVVRRLVNSDLFAPLIAFVAVVLLVTAAFVVAAWLVRHLLRAARILWVDRLLGGAAGLICALVLAGGISLILAAGGDAPLLRDSRLAPVVLRVSGALARLAPPDLRQRFHQGVERLERAVAQAR